MQEKVSVNLGGPVKYTVGEMTKLITPKLCDNNSSIERPLIYEALSHGFPMQRFPDITRARENLQEPQANAREGLKVTLGWFARCNQEFVEPERVS